MARRHGPKPPSSQLGKVAGANRRKEDTEMKKADLCVALRGMAAKLDIQWAYAQRLAAEQAAAGTLAYNEDGEPLPNSAQLCYAGMTAAFEAMGGEWTRNEEGWHWVYLLGVSCMAGGR